MGHAGWIHKRRSRRFTNPLSPISLPLMQLRPHSRLRRARTGRSEVDGSDPPFFLPGAGAGVLRHSHLRSTPWGGGRSRLIIPGGKATNDTGDGQDRTRERPRHPRSTAGGPHEAGGGEAPQSPRLPLSGLRRIDEGAAGDPVPLSRLRPVLPEKSTSDSRLTSHLRSLNRTLTSRTDAQYKTTAGTSGGISKL